MSYAWRCPRCEQSGSFDLNKDAALLNDAFLRQLDTSHAITSPDCDPTEGFVLEIPIAIHEIRS